MKLAALIVSLLLVISCSSGGQDTSYDGGMDADSHTDSDATSTDPPTWRYSSNEGDSHGDCAEGDAQCASDLRNLGFYIEEGTISFQVSFYEPYSGGSFEVFMIPQDVSYPGYSLQFNGSTFHLWKADCTSLLKHSGCHWTEEALPSTMSHNWVDSVTFVFSYPLNELGFDTLDNLLVGAASAPFDIVTTSEFTDRYPDGLLVVSTGIRNLQKIPLNR